METLSAGSIPIYIFNLAWFEPMREDVIWFTLSIWGLPSSWYWAQGRPEITTAYLYIIDSDKN